MSSTYFICGTETANYLQQLMYEADLEAIKKLKRKKKKQNFMKKNQKIMIPKDENGILDLSNINIKTIKFSVPYENN